MKRKLSIISMLLITALMLAGCTDSTPASSESTASTEASSESEASESTDATEELSSSEGNYEPTFDAEAYDLNVKVADNAMFTIVSVYGDSEDDFSKMETVILDAAHAYGIVEDDATISAEFNSIIGSEGGSGKTWDDGGIITSAPNDVEDFYRADLYIYK